jgi:hypothetical protein
VVEFPKCESGGIGRRTRLRIWRVKPWGFESPLSHQEFRADLESANGMCEVGGVCKSLEKWREALVSMICYVALVLNRMRAWQA